MPDAATAAATAFEALADPVRVRILHALTRRVEANQVTAMGFSELRRAADVDDPGRFNYHLDRLQDRFVAAHDDGYIPTYAGLQAVGTVAAGTVTDTPPDRDGELDHRCPTCDRSLTAAYTHDMVTISCPDHDIVLQTAVPPTAADASLPTLVAFANDDIQRDLHRLARGYCPLCSGTVAVTDVATTAEGPVRITVDCQNCFLTVRTIVTALLVRHPAVISHYHRDGIDVRDRLPSDLPLVGDPDATTLQAESPIDVRVTVGEETIRVPADLGIDPA
mgnify:CR=1 FL=1